MRQFIFLFSILALLLLSSCTNMVSDDAINMLEDSMSGQAKSTDTVTTDDIYRIADSFNKTRSSSCDYTLSAINDDNGNVAIYIINFTNDKGFILVSATKNYLPILAYSDSGNFVVSDDMPYGLKIWQEETILAIKYVDTLPSDSVAKYRNCWAKYEEPKVYTSNAPLTLASNDTDIENAKAIKQKYEMELSTEGEIIIDLLGDITGDNALDEEIRSFIKDYIYPIYGNYWSELSFILKKEVDDQTVIDNFVETTWDQENGFNSSYPTINGNKMPAGCGPVAAGQIMYYYKYPSSFDWANMLPNEATTTTSDFLYEIATKANAVFETGTDGKPSTKTEINDINSVLKSYGYTTSIGDHDAATTWKNLRNKQPIYMRANDSNENYGHAWVASGGIYHTYYTAYEIYTFATSTSIVNAFTYKLDYSYAYSFYMNWGWNGQNNGFFLDSILTIPLSNNSYIAKNRVDIYDITPK